MRIILLVLALVGCAGKKAIHQDTEATDLRISEVANFCEPYVNNEVEWKQCINGLRKVEALPDCKVDPKTQDITPDTVTTACFYGDEEL